MLKLQNKRRQCVHAVDRLRGFALVIALVLMAFILLLLLSLTSLTTVELEGGAVRGDIEKARRNALLGLSVALGELQTTLGPDQRVNASASLGNGVEDHRKGWVGVYKSWLDTDATRPTEPEFVRWLVSGDSDLLQEKSTAQGGNIGTPYLGLIRGADDERVEAGLVSVTQDGTTGAFAWWIGDENAKARIAYDKGPAETVTTWLERRQGSAGANLKSLPYVSGIDPSDSRLGMELPRDMLKLLGADEEKDEELLKSLTPYSFGLLTNVRSGGLRKDLSFYLEKAEADRPLEPLYTLEGRNGVHFGELWAYYNLWRNLESATGRSHPDGGTLPAGVPVLKGSTNSAVEKRSPFGVYNRPVMMRAGWMISVRSVLASGAAVLPAEYQMQVVLDPIITLWNPYDVSLDVPAGPHVRPRFYGLPYLIEIFADGQSLNPGGSSFLDTTGLLLGNYVELMAGNAAGSELRMRPGEVLVYSLAGSTGHTVEPKNNLVTAGALGWNREGGILAEVGTPVGEGAIISVAMPVDANKRAVAQWLLFAVEERMGGTGGGEISGGFIIDRRYWKSNTMTPSDYPDVFTDIDLITLGTTQDLSADSATGESGKFPIAFFSMGLRTEEEGRIPGRFLSRATRAAGGFDLQDLSDENLASQGIEIQMHPLTSVSDNPGFDVNNGKGYYGGSYMANSGNSYIITQSIPRTPIYSLASFKHATAGGLASLLWEGSENTSFHERKIEPAVAKIIGNSHALPIFAPGETTGTINDGHPAIDHSYHANMALWDDWFFSSISPRQSAEHQSAGINATQAEVFDAFINDGTPLPNARMKLYQSGDTAAIRNRLFQTDDTPQPAAYERAAESLMVEGMFNVNSTNVDAWVAVLSALRSDATAVVNIAGNLSWDAEAGQTPVPSLLLPAAPALADTDLSDTRKSDQWLGYRSFSDDVIRKLAQTIVEEVRKRGPFLSVADFVNRRVGSDKELAKNGALQHALDKVVNQELMEGSRGVSSADLPAGLPFPEAEAGARSTGGPAYVDQADLLTLIGPGLNVRSDTFVIRTYGEVRNSRNELVATARCEAVVQRVPDYMDATQEPHLAYSELNQTNQRFGRQLKVVSFRWLDEGDI